MCPIDKKKLAVIHIIKKELELSDEEYRAMLKEAAGVDSAKDLDDDKFRDLMRYFVRSSHYKINELGLTIRQRLYIQSLAADMGWTGEHLNNYIHKYYHKTSLNDLSRGEGIKVIQSLKHIMKHSN